MTRFTTPGARIVAATMTAATMTLTLPPAYGQAVATTKSTKQAVRNPAVHKPVIHKETESQKQIRELREAIQAQQAQLNALTQQLATRDAQVQAAQQSTAAAQTQAATAQTQAATAAAAASDASAQAAAASAKADTLSTSVTDLKATNVGLQETVIANQARIEDEIQAPATIHYKGVTITPVAFFAGEGVWRQRSLNSDVNSPFNAIPFPSANEGHVSEFNFSGRQSRLGGLFEGNAGKYKLSGYFEGDFLGTGTSSNNNQSNSYVFRQRQFWGKGEVGNFSITGGQMWSLVTETGLSVNNRTEKLPNTIDAQYMVGFSWTRQPGFRIAEKFGTVKTGMFTAAMSLEQAQITNFTANGTNPAQYFFGGIGQNGGLYNAASAVGAGNTASTGAITTYANNTAPDVVVKGVLDFTHAHFELGGIGRFLRDYYFPVTTTGTGGVPTYTYGTAFLSHTSRAGGIFGSARVTVNKYVDVAVQAMGGQGVGRYGSSQLADATLRPDETLEPLRNYHGLFSLETHPTKKLDVFAYYGGEYAQRTVYTTAAGNLIGYGPRNLSDAGCYNLPIANTATAGSGGSLGAQTCGSPTRYIQEGMIGFTYRVATSPKYGRIQYSMNYQYVQRNLWSGVGSTTTPSGPRALDNMVLTSMRYYIP